MIPGLSGEIAYIALHHRPGFGECCLVAIPQVEIPGDEDAAATPFGRVAKRVAEYREFRCYFGDEAVRRLCVFHVADDLAVKGPDIVAIAHRIAHEVGFFEPTQFLAMGTIGKDTGHIALDRP